MKLLLILVIVCANLYCAEYQETNEPGTPSCVYLEGVGTPNSLNLEKENVNDSVSSNEFPAEPNVTPTSRDRDQLVNVLPKLTLPPSVLENNGPYFEYFSVDKEFLTRFFMSDAGHWTIRITLLVFLAWAYNHAIHYFSH